MFIQRWLSSTGRHANTKKPRIVILGCGWGGFRLARVIDKKKFSVVLISPRNHFVFTPLLPSTAVGTLEFRCVQVMLNSDNDGSANTNTETKHICCISEISTL